MTNENIDRFFVQGDSGILLWNPTIYNMIRWDDGIIVP